MTSNSKQGNQVLHHMSILGLKIEHSAVRKCAAPAAFPPALFPVQNLKKPQQTAPPSTLLGTHHFHTLQNDIAQLGSNAAVESQQAASYRLSCTMRSAVHNPFLAVTIP